MTNKNLIERARAFDFHISLTLEEINKVEQELKLKLPQDFTELCSIYSYECFQRFEFLNFGMDKGVISETLDLRKACNLPNNYLVLEEDDPGMVLMKINEDASSEVIICSYYDFDSICLGRPYEENPTIFSSFTDFYEFLINEEEKMRAEDAVESKM